MTDPDKFSHGLGGTFLRNCLHECSTPIETVISGEIPAWLNGSLYRNGPGLHEIGPDKFRHAFDGMALVHRFNITNGHVTYQNRFVDSENYRKNIRAQRIVCSEFGTVGHPDPCKSWLGRMMAWFWPFKNPNEFEFDNTNVNVIPIGDEIYAHTEGKIINRIDPETLETVGRVDISKYVATNMATAHAHWDADGNVFNMGSSFGRKGAYNILKFPRHDSFEGATVEATIPIRRPLSPAYYHSFSVSENFYIFIEQPLIFDVKKILLASVTGKAFSESLEWRPEYGARFYLVDRKTKEVLKTKYLAKPFAFFHTINAFEDDGHVVVDICCYDDATVFTALNREKLEDTTEPNKLRQYRDSVQSNARRFVLPLTGSGQAGSGQIESDETGSSKTGSGQTGNDKQEPKDGDNLVTLSYTSAKAIYLKGQIDIEEEILTRTASGMAELARINYERHNGKKYRYFYSVGCVEVGRESVEDAIVKFDIDAKEYKYWHEAGFTPSEPVFVPRPETERADGDADAEDDGVVLSAVLNHENENKGLLLFLDAKTFEEVGRAAFETQSAFPGTFHGLFVGKK